MKRYITQQIFSDCISHVSVLSGLSCWCCSIWTRSCVWNTLVSCPSPRSWKQAKAWPSWAQCWREPTWPETRTPREQSRSTCDEGFLKYRPFCCFKSTFGRKIDIGQQLKKMDFRKNIIRTQFSGISLILKLFYIDSVYTRKSQHSKISYLKYNNKNLKWLLSTLYFNYLLLLHRIDSFLLCFIVCIVVFHLIIILMFLFYYLPF